ncbi:bifunctional nuclease family protein [bacterium]|nr:bifunctional nuclease family protein [bacterium]MBU1599987.1 bifunctional nuclease family protein [bacterium]MBU2462002.1 bifunctional nuclease family protein [bacterium]
MTEVEVMGVAFDGSTNMPIVVLKDKRDRTLPIWIGILEAQSILFALENIKTPRPLTHDLLKNIIENLGAELKEVAITNLTNNTFYAKVVMGIDGKTAEIDSRPSDAIALAIRTSSPIFVADSLFTNQTATPIDDDEVKRFKEELKNINLADFL